MAYQVWVEWGAWQQLEIEVSAALKMFELLKTEPVVMEWDHGRQL